MKPYSVDLRERALAALNRGMPRAQVVTTFQVSPASLRRWLAARRATGAISPLPARGGRTRSITLAQETELRAQVAAAPDATVAAHTQRWNADHGTTLSRQTFGRAMRRLGLTRKKSP
jgi:transposase